MEDQSLGFQREDDESILHRLILIVVSFCLYVRYHPNALRCSFYPQWSTARKVLLSLSRRIKDLGQDSWGTCQSLKHPVAQRNLDDF